MSYTAPTVISHGSQACRQARDRHCSLVDLVVGRSYGPSRALFPDWKYQLAGSPKDLPSLGLEKKRQCRRYSQGFLSSGLHC